jgi:hypothetical protein
LTLLLCGLAPQAAAQALLPPLFQTTDLRPYSVARLGVQGRMVGTRATSNTSTLGAIFEDGVWRELGPLPGDQYGALFAINAHGEAVGYSSGYFTYAGYPYNRRGRSVRATALTGLEALPGVDGAFPVSAAYYINDSGVIVGCRAAYVCTYYCDYEYNRAYIRQPDGAIIEPVGLSTPGPGGSRTESCAVDVNNSNVAVGYKQEGGVLRAFRYTSGAATPLAWLEVPGARMSSPRGINEAGDIVGEGRTNDPQVYRDQAYIYTAAGELRDLGLAAGLGAIGSVAGDINEAGDVVGYYERPYSGLNYNDLRAFLVRGGNLFDLNDAVELGPGWTLISAHDIDDAGRILASTRIPLADPPAASTHPYEYGTLLLTPVNRPPTSALGEGLSVGEGGVLSLAGATADDEPGTLQHEWLVVEGPGSIQDASGPNATFSAVGVDGTVLNGTTTSTATVQLKVTDASGATALAQTVLRIDNVPPSATFSATAGTVYANQTVVLSFTGVSDPSAADTFTYAYACSTGAPLGPATTANTHSCTYSEGGDYEVSGQVTDKDGGSSDVYQVTVTVISYQAGAAGLIQLVQSLLSSGVLGDGNANSLISKLEGAIQQLDQGNLGSAVNKLEAFINEVEALVVSGKLTSGQGQPLIDAANGIITALTS